tara:strand:- start:579 stop:1136 length:558 start_codon:yes stop_codon:yes gene_type:complete
MSKKPIKINMGCGHRNFGEDWIHIDGGNHNHLDYNDITKLPYGTNEVDLIYASHVLEYFDREEVVDLLKEWYRVLKPNGIIRLAVPDFKEMAKLYYIRGYDLVCFLGPLYGKMKMGDRVIYHRTVYDINSIKEVLQEGGFSNVKNYDWRTTDHSDFDDYSQAYIPHMDKEEGTLISLNVEAVKKV